MADYGAERRAARIAAKRAAINRGLGVDALLILDALEYHDHGTGEVFVGVPTLHRLTGYSPERIRARLADMVAAGVLADTGRRVRNATVYALPWGADQAAPDVAAAGELAATPPPTSPAPSRNPSRHLSGTPTGNPPVLSTETGQVGALEGEGEGEGEGEQPRPERCALPSCPNHGDYTGPQPCRGCMDARQRQNDRAAEAATRLQAERRAASLQDHPFSDDGSGITCTCTLPANRHEPFTVVPTAVPSRVGAYA